MKIRPIIASATIAASIPPLAAINASPAAAGDVDGDAVGQQCWPWDTPSSPDLVCQATDEDTQLGPHIRNARAGDILLDPGCGEIAATLRAVSPPQRYAHSGILVEDFTTLRHSTASIDRLTDTRFMTIDGIGLDGVDRSSLDGLLSGPDLEIRPDVLRYGWPGTITQSVGAAFGGEEVKDVDTGENYKVGSFSSSSQWCPGDPITEDDTGNPLPGDPTPPLIIKPPPCAGDAARARARDVANAATLINGHYRFHAFSDTTIVGDPAYDAPPGGGWEAGTTATMCSATIWRAATLAGITMEGATGEPGERTPATVDGLYNYRPPERLTAAHALYDAIHRQGLRRVAEAIPDLLGPLTTPIASAIGDDIANQVVSCMWNDSCHPDETGWRSAPGAGDAVSPNDLRQWDSPLTTPGAVYGFEEPAFYRAGDLIARHVWVERPDKTAKVLVHVVDPAGLPIPFADVQLGPAAVIANASGVAAADIPVGHYEVSAFRVLDGVLYEGRQRYDTDHPDVDLVLDPQSTTNREITIRGTASLWDYDIDETPRDEKAIGASAHVDRFSPAVVADINTADQVCTGNEVSGKIHVTTTLQPDNSIIATLAWEWFEDDDSSSACQQGDDERRGSGSFDIPVPADATVTVSVGSDLDKIGGFHADLQITNRYQSYPGVGSTEQCR
jgi:hypothetical protein